MTSVAALWTQLRTEGKQIDGFVSLRVPAVRAAAVYAARRLPGGSECLLVEASTQSLSDSGFPESAGFRVTAETIEPGRDGAVRLIVELMERRYQDVFSALASDIVATLVAARTEFEAISSMMKRLVKWQAFMQKHGSEGLTREQRRGLYGELKFLSDCLLPWRPSRAIQSWKGAEAACHDFQLPNASVEVKTTSAVTPHSIRISNLSQLEPEGAGLWLCLAVVSEHVTASESLPEIVAHIRGQLGDGDADQFTLKLLDAGYLDAQVDLYAEPRYTLRGMRVFEVTEGFPRIHRTVIPDGIEDVRYGVSIAACLPYERDLKAVMRIITSDDHERNT